MEGDFVGHAVQGSQTGVVVTAKALVARQRALIQPNFEAQGLKATTAPAQAGGLRHHARWREKDHRAHEGFQESVGGRQFDGLAGGNGLCTCLGCRIPLGALLAAALGEELAQQGAAGVGQHTAEQLGLVIQALLGKEVQHRTGRAGLRVRAPKTTRLKRACISAIAHIAQGSSVTYSSHSGRR
jgi:hypothetical protein